MIHQKSFIAVVDGAMDSFCDSAKNRRTLKISTGLVVPYTYAQSCVLVDFRQNGRRRFQRVRTWERHEVRFGRPWTTHPAT